MIVGIVLSAFMAKAEETYADSVRVAVERWMAQYPESQYADIYKNFFQDSFGPGHILSDKEAARKYLEKELSSAVQMDGPEFEPTGERGQFVRVNLSLIRDGIIPVDTYFEAFVESMDGLTLPTDEEWRSRWTIIDNIIRDMGIKFPDEEADREVVREALESGNFAVHHSQRYNEAYSRHYRIIRSDIVAKGLLKY